MLNFIQGTTGPAIIYANTISNADITYGNYFLFDFQSTYSKRHVYVVPTVEVRNERYIEFTVGATGLQEMQNWTYSVYNFTAPSNVPAPNGILIDQGQAFLTPA
jgi:hypothetical protein